MALTLAVVSLYSRFHGGESELQPTSDQHLKTYRLLDVMHQLQNYSTKLYFAGTARNEELARWYSWKLESAVQDITQHRIEPYAYNGWDAAELAIMLDAPIADLNATLIAQQWGDFEDRFDMLMRTCNACHAAAEHHFIVVRASAGEPAPPNQRFD